MVVAVLASLLVARLLTPLMASRWLKPHPTQERADGRLMTAYLAMSNWCLDHRKTTMAAAAIFFAASLGLAPFIPSGLIPPSDSGFTTVNIETRCALPAQRAKCSRTST